MKRLEQFGMKFVGHDVDGERMEIMELEGITIFFYMYLGMAKRIVKNRTVMPESYDVGEVSQASFGKKNPFRKKKRCVIIRPS